MATVDGEQHEVSFHVAVIGGVGKRFVELLNAKDGELELGEVRGVRPRFVFEIFPDDPWSGDGKEGAALEELLPYVDALVLTDDFSAGSHFSSSAIERLAKALTPARVRIPTAVFGGPALAEEWQSLAAVPPLHVAEPKSDDALSVVKALTKALLRSSVRSTPPPPKVH